MSTWTELLKHQFQKDPGGFAVASCVAMVCFGIFTMLVAGTFSILVDALRPVCS